MSYTKESKSSGCVVAPEHKNINKEINHLGPQEPTTSCPGWCFFIMTYKETKEHGAHAVVYTTYYGYGDYIVNSNEVNKVTGNEFFTPEEAQKCIELLKEKGYISQDEFDKNPRENVYTYEMWDDADEYLDDKIEEE